MDEKNPVKNECELVFEIFHCGGVTTSYHATLGLSRRLMLAGIIDDAWYDDYYYKDSSAFHQKPLRLILHSPPNLESLEKERKYFMGGLGELCGAARINAGVAPDRFDIKGREYESEPVQIELFLSPDAFAAIRDQALEAYNKQLTIRATMTLVGDALQQIKRDPTMPWPLKPRQLDTSVFHGYGVKSFEICTMQSEST